MRLLKSFALSFAHVVAGVALAFVVSLAVELIASGQGPYGAIAFFLTLFLYWGWRIKHAVSGTSKVEQPPESPDN